MFENLSTFSWGIGFDFPSLIFFGEPEFPTDSAN